LPTDNSPDVGYLTPDEFTPTDYVCGRLRIPDNQYFLAAVMGALTDLTNADSWELYGTMTPENAAYLALTMYNDFRAHQGTCMLGTIVAIATTLAPTGTLICDGSTYLRADYPDLYALLLPAYQTDADHFVTPDLRGKTVIGASFTLDSTTYVPNSTLGEFSHTLTTDEMPSHSHTNTPHDHIYGSFTDIPVLAGLDPVPASAMLPTPSVTTPAGVVIDNTGGGDAHNNVQPSLVLQYAIVAL
jgi:microcystin-dependent protein